MRVEVAVYVGRHTLRFDSRRWGVWTTRLGSRRYGLKVALLGRHEHEEWL